ncbi:MAG: YbaK/EbsC family protein [Thermomicrobiales bacterium]|nr:YbaK/EbsC family protein [Thermomicrobiales bacterium]
MVQSADRILVRLHERQVPYRLLSIVPGPTPTSHPKLTTIAFRSGRGIWTLVVIRLGDTIDLARLARVIGVRPADLTPISAADAHDALGYDLDSLAPIPPTNQARVIFDEAVARLDIAWCGSGRAGQTLEIRVHDLLAIAGGRVVRLVRD